MRKPRISQRSIRNRFNSRSSPLHNNTRWYENRSWRGGGDGSTLSLDFTAMSGLDSRLTFTRSTDATFINSNGLVQWANANIVRRSEDCTNWGGSQNITPTADAAIAPNGTQTADQLNLSATSYRYQITAASKVIGGQRYTGSIYVRAVSGTAQVNLRIANTADGNNGVAVTQTVGETWTRLQGSFTLASNGTLIDIGLDQRTGIPNAGPGVAANVYVWGLQLQPGGIAGEYLQTTTTENYNTPRFDYGPTTLAPRGLLIEGSVVNIFPYSNAMTGGQYEYGVSNSLTATFNNTETASPDGSNNSVKVVKASGGQTYTFVRNQVTPQTSGVQTGSVWVKKPATSGSRYVGLRLTGAGFAPAVPDRHLLFDLDTGTVVTGLTANGYYTNPTIVAYPNGWYRISITSGTMSTGSGSAYLSVCMSTPALDGSEFNTLPAGTCFYMFGPQAEAGSGASSYIPTGSSTVQRAVDQMTMANISALSFNQAGGTVFMQIEGNPKDVNTFPYFAAFEQSPSGRGWAFLRLNNSTVNGTRMLGTAFTAAGATIISSTSHTRPSGKFKFATTLEPSVCRMTYVIAGGSALVDTVAAGTLATIGSLKFNNTTDTGASEFGSVWISQFKYWPSVLPNATLQSITA